MNSRRPIDLTGQTFGRFTALSLTRLPSALRGWKCRCVCGSIRTVATGALRWGRYQSCGCLRIEKSKLNIKKAILPPRSPKPCECCGEPFVGFHKTNRFCSRYCAVRGRSGKCRRIDIKKQCLGCGKIMRGTARKKLQKYCSHQCQDPSQSIRNYQKGMAGEMEVEHLLHHQHFLTFRMRSSRGPFDVVAVNEKGILLIQVKVVERNHPCRTCPPKAVEYLAKVPSGPRISKQIWAKIPNGSWIVTEVA